MLVCTRPGGHRTHAEHRAQPAAGGASRCWPAAVDLTPLPHARGCPPLCVRVPAPAPAPAPARRYLTHGPIKLAQSGAIVRYIAKLAKMDGRTVNSWAQHEMLISASDDIYQLFREALHAKGDKAAAWDELVVFKLPTHFKYVCVRSSVCVASVLGTLARGLNLRTTQHRNLFRKDPPLSRVRTPHVFPRAISAAAALWPWLVEGSVTRPGAPFRTLEGTWRSCWTRAGSSQGPALILCLPLSLSLSLSVSLCLLLALSLSRALSPPLARALSLAHPPPPPSPPPLCRSPLTLLPPMCCSRSKHGPHRAHLCVLVRAHRCSDVSACVPALHRSPCTLQRGRRRWRPGRVQCPHPRPRRGALHPQGLPQAQGKSCTRATLHEWC